MALDVVVRMSAQEAGAYRAWMEQQKAIQGAKDKLDAAQQSANQLGGSLGDAGGKLGALGGAAGQAGGKFKGLGDSTKGAKGELVSYFEANVGKWASVAGGINIAKEALHTLAEAYRQVAREEAEVTFRLDEAFATVATQGALSPQQKEQYKQRSLDIAENLAMQPETVFEGTRQLISSSFTPEETFRQGGAGEQFMMGVQAMAGGGKNFDIAEGGKGIAQYMKGFYGEQNLTGENMAREIREIVSLYMSKDIQPADLKFLARTARQAHDAGIDSTTLKATFTELLNYYPAEIANTSMRKIINTIRAPNEAQQEGLAMFGLSKENVDLVGEDLTTVFARFNRATGKLKQEHGDEEGVRMAQEAFSKIFGQEAMNQAATLSDEYQKIPEYAALSRDWSAFDKGLQNYVGPGNKAAAKRRLETQAERQRWGGPGATNELITKAIETQNPARPVESGLRATAFSWLAPFIGTEPALVLSQMGGSPQQFAMNPLLALSRVQAASQGPNTGPARAGQVVSQFDKKKVRGPGTGGRKKAPSAARREAGPSQGGTSRRARPLARRGGRRGPRAGGFRRRGADVETSFVEPRGSGIRTQPVRDRRRRGSIGDGAGSDQADHARDGEQVS